MIDQLAWPWVLLGLLLIPAIAVVRARRRSPSAVFSAVERARAVGGTWRTHLRALPLVLRLIALALLVVAIARPQTVSSRTESSTEGIAIQLVLDRSRSMDDPGVLDGREVTRLEAAKQVVAEFVAGDGDALEGRQNDLVGLIAFGTYADTLCPLVREHGALLDILSRVEIPIFQDEGGTAIGDALTLACARLRDAENAYAESRAEQGEPDAEFASKVIVLLTDGENTQGQLTPRQGGELAREWGIRVYIIGIRGGVTRSAFGRALNLGQEVNERELTTVAEMTGGRFFPVEDLAELRPVYDAINELEKTEIIIDEQTEYEERFMPFAAVAFALLGLESLLGWTLLRRIP
ncbi:MAG: VWA domain-containing protein [Phycisphaerales bacterium]